MVLPGDVVGDEVDDDFQSGLVRAFDKRLKLGHAVGDIDGEVGGDVVVILHGVG